MDLKNVMYSAFSKFTNAEIIEQLEQIRWPYGVVSPYDERSKVYKCNHGYYKCKNTNRQFNVQKGTILENTKKPLFVWIYAMHMLCQKGRGLSSYQYERSMNSTAKTGWYNNHKVRVCMGVPNYSHVKLTGVVEGDETHVGGKNVNRHEDKKFTQIQGGSNQDKVQVLGLVERGGHLRAFVVPNTKKASLQPMIERAVSKDAIIMTDDWGGYDGLKKKGFNHIWTSEYDIDETMNPHTNTIENCWTQLKRNYKGMYFKMDRFHVQRYVDEMVFRYNTRNLTDGERLIELLKLIMIPVTYKDIKDPARKIKRIDMQSHIY